MITIFIKEINDFLHSLIGYLVMGVFLIGIGLIMWVIPDTNVLEFGYASMEPLFSIGPYLLMFLVPAVTMRSFAEEKKNGTIELLQTLPFHSWDLVMGKFLAGFVLVIISILPTVIYCYSLYSLGNPVGNLDVPGILGSYLGLILLGGLFTSLGILMSTISQNQVIAFITSAAFCFLFYDGFYLISTADFLGNTSLLIRKFGILSHYTSLSKGLIDLGNLVYFLGVMAIALMISRYNLESDK